MELTLYWIHLPEHTEEHLEGYVGITMDFDRRMAEHSKKAPNDHFQNAINKYGWDNLIKEKVVSGPADDIIDLEKVFRPSKEIGWNCEPGGGLPPNHTGVKRSQEFCERIAQQNREWVRSDTTKQKISQSKLGKVLTEEHKKRLSEVNTGKQVTDETKQKLRDAKLGKPGILHSEEAKQKIGEAQRGKKRSEETKRKISEANKVRWSKKKEVTNGPESFV